MSPLCRLNGLGTYVPDQIITNHDLEKLVETSDEWITSRTGIKRRRKAAPGQSTSDLALMACRNLFSDERLGIQPSDITHIFFATITPDSLCPSTACNLSAKLGIPHVPALDFNAACSGFLYGLTLAHGLVTANPNAKVLLVAGDVITSRLNWQDRGTCVLFGDGAGAVVVTNASAGRGEQNFSAVVDDLDVHADSGIGHYLQVGVGGSSSAPYKLGDSVKEDFFIHMDGREVFKHAVRNMSRVSADLLERNNLTVDDLQLVIPHQANARIIEAVAKKLDVPDAKLFMNVQEYGNTSAVSLLIALQDAYMQKKLSAGNKTLLTTFGAGFTWGSAILTIE